MVNSEIILLNINGEDKPGLTAALTEILAKHDAFILDIGQSDIHRNLSLGILFKSKNNNSGEIMKDLLFKAYEMDVNIRFTPISAERYSNWVGMQGKTGISSHCWEEYSLPGKLPQFQKLLPSKISISIILYA